MNKDSIKKQLIEFQKHQEDTVSHIVSKCTQQHGLLVFHGLGTGKTLTGILFLMNFIDIMDIIIILPYYLIPVWSQELFKMNINKSKIKFISYNNIESIYSKNLKNTVIIMDEAHNIVNYVENKSKRIITKLNECFKILLLTATPIYTKETDISYLLNIAAGYQLVPYNVMEFKKIYFKAELTKAIPSGWIVPVIADNWLSSINRFRTQYAIIFLAGIKYLFSTKAKSLDKLIGYFYNIEDRIAFKYIDNIVKILSSFKKLDFLKENPEASIAPSIMVLKMFIIPIILTIISLYFKTIDTHKLYDIYTLNEKKFLKDTSSYISYYTPKYNDENYPTVNKEYVAIQYTQFQSAMWVKSTLGYSDELIKLSDNQDIDNINDENMYLYNTRLIGNLSDTSYCPKFIKVYSKFGAYGNVVYSNFYRNGLLLFAKFLDTKDIKYTILEPGLSVDNINKILDNFKNQSIKTLLLHPSYTEGLSILGARQLHILEPPVEFSQLNQIMGRVSRYMSHSHLPLKERNVNIFIWYCSSISMLSILQKNIEYIKIWMKHFKGVYPKKLETKFNYDISPDSIIIKKYEQLEYFVNRIQGTMSSKHFIKTCSNNESYIDKCDVSLHGSCSKFYKKQK